MSFSLVAGAEVIKADMSDEDAVKSAVEGAYGLFLVIPQPNAPELDMDKEIQQVRIWDRSQYKDRLSRYDDFHYLTTVLSLRWEFLIWLMHPYRDKNGHHLAEDILKFIFFYKHCGILIEASLNFSKCPTNNKAALVQKIAWCRIGDNPLSEPMVE